MNAYATTVDDHHTTTTQHSGWTISKPGVTNTIVLYKEKPDFIFTYNAKFLHANMKAKYGIEEVVCNGIANHRTCLLEVYEKTQTPNNEIQPRDVAA